MSRTDELAASIAQIQAELSELVRLGASDSRVDLMAARITELERRVEQLERADHPSRRGLRQA
jgi:vacuolar-type H+-ATPase subunit D/Vma8